MRNFFRIYLNEELEKRCRANPRYSLRAFAKLVDVDPSTLSKVLRGKAGLNPRNAEKILGKTNASPKERQLFLSSLDQTRWLDKKKSPPVKVSKIDQETFRVISDWYHYAILEMTFSKGFSSDPRVIAKKLGIGVMEARFAIARLISTGQLLEIDGVLVKRNQQLTTTDRAKTNDALKKYTDQILEKAAHSNTHDAIGIRSMFGMSMSIDPDKLNVARAMIEEFTMNLCSFLESGTQKQVYHFQTCLFPLEKSDV